MAKTKKVTLLSQKLVYNCKTGFSMVKREMKDEIKKETDVSILIKIQKIFFGCSVFLVLKYLLSKALASQAFAACVFC